MTEVQILTEIVNITAFCAYYFPIYVNQIYFLYITVDGVNLEEKHNV